MRDLRPFLSNVLLFSIQLLHGPASATSTCYRPNGIAGDSNIRPCHSNLSSSANDACCNLGKSPPDLCLAGGLCYRQDSSDGNALIYAVGCTDATGADAACQQYCPTGKGVAMYSLNACSDGTWCCNDLTAETCCNKLTGAGTFTMNHFLSLDPAPSATSSSASAATGTASTTQSPACASPSCSSKTGAIVGASVGAAVGAFIIAMLATCLFMRKFKLSSRQRQDVVVQAAATNEAKAETQPLFGWRHEADGKATVPISSVAAISEPKLQAQPSAIGNTGPATGQQADTQSHFGWRHEVDGTVAPPAGNISELSHRPVAHELGSAERAELR